MKRITSTVCVLCAGAFMTSCEKDPAGPEIGYSGPDTNNRITILLEGFEQGTNNWTDYTAFTEPDHIKMVTTGAASHTGAMSATGDSNRTALFYEHISNPDSGIIAGIQFYCMAHSLGHINFSVRMGRVCLEDWFEIAFGIGFHKSDSIMTIFLDYSDTMGGYPDHKRMHAPIKPGHWYKCVMEADFSTDSVFYFIDDRLVRAVKSGYELWFFNAVLAIRGINGENDEPGIDGAKPYYVDDIHYYTRKIAGK